MFWLQPFQDDGKDFSVHICIGRDLISSSQVCIAGLTWRKVHRVERPLSCRANILSLLSALWDIAAGEIYQGFRCLPPNNISERTSISIARLCSCFVLHFPIVISPLRPHSYTTITSESRCVNVCSYNCLLNSVLRSVFYFAFLFSLPFFLPYLFTVFRVRACSLARNTSPSVRFGGGTPRRPCHDAS